MMDPPTPIGRPPPFLVSHKAAVNHFVMTPSRHHIRSGRLLFPRLHAPLPHLFCRFPPGPTAGVTRGGQFAEMTQRLFPPPPNRRPRTLHTPQERHNHSPFPVRAQMETRSVLKDLRHICREGLPSRALPGTCLAHLIRWAGKRVSRSSSRWRKGT